MGLDLRINLHKLEVFCSVVELGGVGVAAEKLFVSQPVVTAHLRSLEQRLGTKLFYRKGHHIHLTESGLVVHTWAQTVLGRSRELDKHLEGLLDGRQGTVVIGASMSVGCYRLPNLVWRFKSANPGAEIRLNITDTEHAVEETRTGELDFAVVVSDDEFAPHGVVAERVGTDEVVLVGSRGQETGGEEIPIERLAELPFVDAPAGIVRRTFIDKQLSRLGVPDRRVVLELGHPEAMKRASGEGAGVVFLFRSAVEKELRAGTLREIRVEGVELVFPIFAVFRKGKTLSPLHRNLVDEIRIGLST